MLVRVCACDCICTLVCNLQAILFNTIILPECTAETGERQMTLQARPGCISDTHRAIHPPARAPTHPQINPGDVSANLIPRQRGAQPGTLQCELNVEAMGKLIQIAEKVQANRYPSVL